jgi:hypothetical protein
MKTDVHQVNNPATDAGLVTPWLKEKEGTAQRAGFSEDLGVVFKAASWSKPGLEPVYRLWSHRSGDFMWTMHEGDKNRAVRAGYELQSANFYASSKPLDCGVAVYRYFKGNKHRMAASEEYRAQLEAAGWVSEGVRFWAAAPSSAVDPSLPGDPEPPVEEPPVVEPPVEEPPVVEPPVEEPPVVEPPVEEPSADDTTFSLAVIPDTQQDVFSKRITNRAEWLVANRDELDLQFVLHTGDVVNWDTPEHEQFADASTSLKILDDAGIPTALAIGNHDTFAVGEGGSARDPHLTRQYARETSTFNAFFPPSRYAPEGTFEAGKIDNNFQLFEAGGEKWMILTLEFNARPAAVDWARDVVASHPEHNVIVQTHSYLDSWGNISSRAEYGDTAGTELYKRLVSVYPNIRMVFSGHVGQSATRQDVGVNGNKIVSFLGAFHSNKSNPIRMVEIDTAADTITSTVYSPIDDRKFPQYDKSFSGLDFD